ncbi:hypothetical protein [Pseudoxanthomonas composti]|uniref:Uncharacterized protein n=1 Tax=Pseudoxanthomonas composti TaxID=2137479 RepID=A0A4Q1JUC4_9GAMM|nr:hypothetical protein [Pseudoxanthomonas composti]RXR05300.1 hypothetical protein EPA99_11200 [Pseudoxanthomonas composti]
MNAQHDRQAPWVMIDIEAEKSYWRERYQLMPRAGLQRGFEHYWPVLGAVYDAYINHPTYDSDLAQYTYAKSQAVQMAGLDPRQASEVFSLVWGRIAGQRLSSMAARRGDFQPVTA